MIDKHRNILANLIDLGIKISTIKYDMDFEETGRGLEHICKERLQAEHSRFIMPEEVRSHFEPRHQGYVRNKTPFTEGEGVYIPFASDGEGNLGVLYLRNSLITNLEEPEQEQLLLFLSRMGGLILAKTRDVDVLRKQSRYDSLTGLIRKGEFFREWGLEKRAWGLADPYSILMIDIDDFKKYNDSYGHLQGDVALAAVGQAVRTPVNRPQDRKVRYGGEEILIALPKTDKEGAAIVSERIRQAVESLVLDTTRANKNGGDYERGPESLTISVGFSTFPSLSDSMESLISDADKALYSAKKRGKNQVVAYSED